MVRAWYIDNDPTNPREEHQQFPPKFITLENLYEITGIEHHQLDTDAFEIELDKIKNDRGYQYEDFLETPNIDELNQYFTEHFHKDDEIRFVLDGCGYYDVRDNNDKWIRIEVLPGDLIVIPSGCYHRFMLDNKNSIQLKRLYRSYDIYEAYHRPADDLECRRKYLEKLNSGAFKIDQQ